MNTRIKICGITCGNDIRIVNKYLPDYAGFVFAESRRRVSAETAKSLGGGLDPRIKKAGVFVDMGLEQLAEIAEKAGLEVVQLHGGETRDYIDRLRMKLLAGGQNRTQIWKAVRVSDKSSLRELSGYRADFYLTDTYVKGMQGGSGVRFDWSLLSDFPERNKIIMAGGLTPDNVNEAVTTIRPFGVDVSSGVEMDGKKSDRLVGEFIRRVREIRPG